MPTASDSPSPTRPTRRLSRRRRLVFAAVALLLVVLVAESSAFVGWRLTTGHWFTWSSAEQRRVNAMTEQAADGAGRTLSRAEQMQRALNVGNAQHPFLGFVVDADLPQGPNALPISRYGFLDSRSPVQKRSADRFLVAVTGGSVSVQMSHYARDVLADELSRLGAAQGRRVEIVPLGLGGYKQPQQLFSLEYVFMLGGEFDLVLDVDGFNEIALVNENLDTGTPAFYPRSWPGLLDQDRTSGQQLRIGKRAFLIQQRSDRAVAAGTFWWSPLAQLLWLVRDRRVGVEITDLAVEIERGRKGTSFAMTGPGTGGLSTAQAIEQMADVWQQCSRDMSALCRARGIPYFHFLQPNQYVAGSKPLSEEERAKAFLPALQWSTNAAAGYPLLRQRGEALRRDGVRFVDLTQIFRQLAQTLYVDTCCHLNREGYALLARSIADTVRAELDLDGVRLAALRAEPDPLVVRSPLAPPRIVVTGIADDGRQFDVTAAGLGTRIAMDDASLLTLDAQGNVAPLRRGRGALTIDRAGLALSVPVELSWPDVVTGDDATARGVEPPRLVLVHDDRASGSAEVECQGLGSGPWRFLVHGGTPPPDRPPEAPVPGLTTTPLAPGQDRVRVSVPWPTGDAARDRPLFVRAYVLGEKNTIRAASNTLVLTRP